MTSLNNNTLPGEEWRPIPGFYQYEASSLGRVRSLKFRPIRILKPWSRKGYETVSLSIKGRMTKRAVHHLVLEAFVGARPHGLEGCHENGQKDDNRLSNLRWDTHAANAHDTNADGRRSVDHLRRGLTSTQRQRGYAGIKLTPVQVVEIRAKWIPHKYSMPKLAKEYGVHRSMIQAILDGKAWTWV